MAPLGLLFSLAVRCVIQCAPEVLNRIVILQAQPDHAGGISPIVGPSRPLRVNRRISGRHLGRAF